MKYTREGGRLRQIRAGRTLEEVGAHVGLSGPAVRHWETGRSRPDRETAAALDDLFGTAGEITALYGYTTPGGPSLADLDAKLDRLIDGQAGVLAGVSNSIAKATDAVTAELVKLTREVRALQRRADRRAGRDSAGDRSPHPAG